MSEMMLISDAAKEVNVENHVLRYWEEELHLPIKRNELGHRYYTKEDIERFKQIKSMKERGLQLKAIKMILKNGRIDILSGQQGEEETTDPLAGQPLKQQEERTADIEEAIQSVIQTETPIEKESMNEDNEQVNVSKGMAIDIVDSRDIQETDTKHSMGKNAMVQETREDKSRRLQWLLQQLIRETLQENNQQLCSDIKESVVKELDYQFRLQEEHEEERSRKQIERSEEYYKKMDELLRKKGEKKKRHFFL